MKDNGQYVGVDEKYVPEDEKHVDNTLNGEIKNDLHNAYQGAKNYVSDKDNQEKMKNAGRKGLKIAKGLGIGYLIFVGIIFIMVLVGVIFVFSQFLKIKAEVYDNNIKGATTNIINKSIDGVNEGYNKIQASNFNFYIEDYTGTQDGSDVVKLLDYVITNIQKYTDHSITVVYGTTITSKAEEIMTLKKQFDATSQYEVLLSYDSNGYVNKVTITNY